MKVEELRIGNLVKSKRHDLDIVTQIGKSNVWGKFNEDILPMPIPLTDEWLIKFGLDDNVMWGGIIVFIEDTKDWIIKNKYGKNIVIGKYVHQLQNLHYAITGDELNLLI